MLTSAFPRPLAGIALAILLHAAAVLFWLFAPQSAYAPTVALPTMQVSLVSAPAPVVAPPTPEPPPPEPKPQPKPKPPKQLAVRAKPDPAPTRMEIPAAAASDDIAPTTPAPPVAAAAPAAADPGPVQPPRFDAAYLANPAPAYPPLSRRMGETGRVMLRVRVSADGLPSTIDIAQSSGFPRLDEAARDAVRGWKFVPARQGERAIAAAVLVPIVFKLN